MLRRPHSSRSSRRAARDGWRGGCQGFGRFLGGRCAQRHLCLLLCRREASLTPPRVLFAWPVSHTRVFCLHGQSHTHTRVCLFRILAPPHFFPHIQSHQCIVIFIFWHYDSHYPPPPLLLQAAVRRDWRSVCRYGARVLIPHQGRRLHRRELLNTLQPLLQPRGGRQARS